MANWRPHSRDVCSCMLSGLYLKVYSYIIVTVLSGGASLFAARGRHWVCGPSQSMLSPRGRKTIICSGRTASTAPTLLLRHWLYIVNRCLTCPSCFFPVACTSLVMLRANALIRMHARVNPANLLLPTVVFQYCCFIVLFCFKFWTHTSISPPTPYVSLVCVTLHVSVQVILILFCWDCYFRDAPVLVVTWYQRRR